MISRNCAGCGAPLFLSNVLVDDGCPCNSVRGINFEPRHCTICNDDNCVKPGHHLAALLDLPPSVVPQPVESTLREVGATSVRIDIGPDAFIDYGFAGRAEYAEEDEGWDVVDNRRRFPRKVAASLRFEDAVRFAKNVSSTKRPL